MRLEKHGPGEGGSDGTEETRAGPEGGEPASHDREEQRVPLKLVLNKLNLLHFEERVLFGVFRHRRYDRRVVYPLAPLPCEDHRLDCRWAGRERPAESERYTFEFLFLEDGAYMLVIRAELDSMTDRGVSLRLDDRATYESGRRLRRHPARGVDVQIHQDGVVWNGVLHNFTAEAFLVELLHPGDTRRWLNERAGVHLMLARHSTVLYSGHCVVAGSRSMNESLACVLKPEHSSIQRFPPKEFRSRRQELNPRPDWLFVHPLSGAQVTRKVRDMSGTGFSVLEKESDSLLIAGLIAPETRIVFPNRAEIALRAQIIYRAAEGDEPGMVRCGVAFLDISPQDHLALVSMLQQTQNHHAYVSADVDLHELWRFFFESGFIYPSKYAYLAQHREEIRKTYDTLYNHQPQFARHFVFRDDSHILGHISMMRYFPRSWLIQHHAADVTNGRRAGLRVLNQVGTFTNDAHRFAAMGMDYLMCFYRRENRFPRRVFGGTAEAIGDRKACSEDTFTYFHVPKVHDFALDGDRLWTLDPPHAEDLLDLRSHYEGISGGLLVDAFNLIPGADGNAALIAEYRQLGVSRQISTLALKKNGRLNAIIVLSLADIGVNLSELTNSIAVLTVEPTDLDRRVLMHVLSSLTGQFSLDEVPVLVYPTSVADDCDVVYEKEYTLWVLNTEYGDDYFRFLKTMIPECE
jgi:hypothetical protein